MPDDSDSKPVTQLLIESQSSLYGFIFSLLGSGEEAGDVLQETNLALLGKADEYDHSRNFMSWATRFAYLQVLAHRKRKGRDRLWFDVELINVLAEETSESLVGPDARLSTLSQCFQKLSPMHQGLLDRYYKQGLTYAEIADTEGRSAGSVAVLMCRIRKRLHDCMQRSFAIEGLK